MPSKDSFVWPGAGTHPTDALGIVVHKDVGIALPINVILVHAVRVDNAVDYSVRDVTRRACAWIFNGVTGYILGVGIR